MSKICVKCNKPITTDSICHNCIKEGAKFDWKEVRRKLIEEGEFIPDPFYGDHKVEMFLARASDCIPSGGYYPQCEADFKWWDEIKLEADKHNIYIKVLFGKIYVYMLVDGQCEICGRTLPSDEYQYQEDLICNDCLSFMLFSQYVINEGMLDIKDTDNYPQRIMKELILYEFVEGNKDRAILMFERLNPNSKKVREMFASTLVSELFEIYRTKLY